MDVLEQGLPDGVLQGARVLGGREVLVGQVGLVNLPLEPGRTAGEKAARGTGSCPGVGAPRPPSGQLMKGEVTSEKAAGPRCRCPLVPLPTSLAITLSFLIYKMGTS